MHHIFNDTWPMDCFEGTSTVVVWNWLVSGLAGRSSLEPMFTNSGIIWAGLWLPISIEPPSAKSLRAPKFSSCASFNSENKLHSCFAKIWKSLLQCMFSKHDMSSASSKWTGLLPTPQIRLGDKRGKIATVLPKSNYKLPGMSGSNPGRRPTCRVVGR